MFGFELSVDSLTSVWETLKTIVGWLMVAFGAIGSLVFLLRWLRGERPFSLRGECLNFVREASGRIIACVEPILEVLFEHCLDPLTRKAVQAAASKARVEARRKGGKHGPLLLSSPVLTKNFLTTLKGLAGEHLKGGNLERYMEAARIFGYQPEARMVSVYIVAVADAWTDDRFQCVRFMFFFDWEIQLEEQEPGWMRRLVSFPTSYQSDKAEHIAWVAGAVQKAKMLRAERKKEDDPLPGEAFGFTELRLTYNPAHSVAALSRALELAVSELRELRKDVLRLEAEISRS